MQKIEFYSIILYLLFLTACSKNSNSVTDSDTVDRTANLQGAGDSANDILSNDNFDKLIIEIGYVNGFRPTEETMVNFIDFFLKLYTFKEDIEFVYNELPSPNKEKLSLDEIAMLESQNRTIYNQGSTLAVYLYFTDVKSEDDNEEESLITLGAAYRNTSMIIFETNVRSLASKSPFITNTDVETATVTHEFGHLFGLVNLGTPMINPHEDPESPNHCNVEDCLMQAKLDFGVPINKSPISSIGNIHKGTIKAGCSLSGQSVLQILENRTSKGLAAVVNLDQECIRDIKANGGKFFN